MGNSFKAGDETIWVAVSNARNESIWLAVLRLWGETFRVAILRLQGDTMMAILQLGRFDYLGGSL